VASRFGAPGSQTLERAGPTADADSTIGAPSSGRSRPARGGASRAILAHRPMEPRFAAFRVRPAHRDENRSEPRAVERLLIEWPSGGSEPTKYWLSTIPEHGTLEELVRLAKIRWRIERDYEEMKSELGLDHYEGRGWLGFHHHGVLRIAANALLAAERARLPPQASCLPPSASSTQELPPAGRSRRVLNAMCPHPSPRSASEMPGPSSRVFHAVHGAESTGMRRSSYDTVVLMPQADVDGDGIGDVCDPDMDGTVTRTPRTARPRTPTTGRYPARLRIWRCATARWTT
jgi:hypothetical protein